MSNIILYKCSDDNRKMNKTLENVKSYTNFTLRGDSSITDPDIFIKYDSSGVKLDFNYMYIEEFGRYYFVRDIVAVPGGLQVKGHVDVLMTHKSQLNEVAAIVERSTVNSNKDIIDPMMKTVQYKQIDIYKSDKETLTNDMHHYLVIAG